MMVIKTEKGEGSTRKIPMMMVSSKYQLILVLLIIFLISTQHANDLKLFSSRLLLIDNF